MEKTVIAVLGGDKRMDFAARELVRMGYDVREWGRGEGNDAVAFSKVAKEWLSDVDALMLPLPTSLDGTHLATPLCQGEEKLRMETLFSVAPDKLWLVGRFSESLRLRAEREGVRWIDYFESEILQLKNALPTAEGAIEIAMRELPVVLDGTKVSVIGYGRIGEVLSHKLKALGADVTVWARRYEACTRAELLGHSAKRIVGESSLDFDTNTRVIFNTVPSRLFTRTVLQTLGRECIIIDLASVPGGVDTTAAAELGIRSIWATALPGKCAPESAGVILGQTVHTILLDALRRSDF
ncbi:MAG: dipicolinate synthase [Ruminococcaceae bacterium]|nr:dipicolinate synthase [Oscillospiraceae bacterium]